MTSLVVLNCKRRYRLLYNY